MNKETRTLVIAQIVCSAIVILFFYLFSSGLIPGLSNSKNSNNSNSTTDSETLNAISARLGQVQMDLYQIKLKVGAAAPTN